MSVETISKIERVYDVHVMMPTREKTCDGWRITTTRDVIELLIENETSCCESWGYATAEDDPGVFIGAGVVRIDVTNSHWGTVSWCPNPGDYDIFEAMFVTIVTDRGPFQIAAYNGHNGYYEHDVIARSSLGRVSILIGL